MKMKNPKTFVVLFAHRNTHTHTHPLKKTREFLSFTIKRILEEIIN